MYAFFVVFGFLFVCISSTFLNYIYDVFPINKITNFLSPINNKNSWNQISIVILPIFIWSFIELPILGVNNNFILAILANILISCAIIYEIKYAALFFFDKENNTINLVSIYIATLFGQTVSFLVLKMKPFFNSNLLISFISLLIIFGIFILIKLYPPKRKVFIRTEKKD